MHKNFIIICTMVSIVGCSFSSIDNTPYEGYDEDYTSYDEEVTGEVSIQNEVTLREATEQVVIDIRGKKNAQSYMNFQKPIVQCGVMLPGRIVGASIIPPQEGCIVMAPGAFIDSSTLTLPLGDEAND